MSSSSSAAISSSSWLASPIPLEDKKCYLFHQSTSSNKLYILCLYFSTYDGNLAYLWYPPVEGMSPPYAPAYGPFIDIPNRDPLVGNTFAAERLTLFERYTEPGVPRPQRAFIWLLFSPPNGSTLGDGTLSVLSPVVFPFSDTEACAAVVVGTALFPLKRLNGFET